VVVVVVSVVVGISLVTIVVVSVVVVVESVVVEFDNNKVLFRSETDIFDNTIVVRLRLVTFNGNIVVVAVVVFSPPITLSPFNATDTCDL
jgi:hypothetical protein